jgi:hypothetical protein
VVELAGERLARYPHVVVRTGAIPDGLPLEEDFDLVVASEVLTRLPGDAFRRTVDRLPLVLHPGSRLVAVHWAGQGPRQERTAADTHRALGIGTGLRRAELPPPSGTRGYLLDAFDMR